MVDLLIKNVSIYNTVFQKFFVGDVYILKDKIYYIDLDQDKNLDVKDVIDGTGKYMVPGLIDIHMHIESSMMTPLSMSYRLAECGVTTIVSEPHEMANVNGTQGILDMIEAGKNGPIDIFYGIPSCVPATNPSLEATGGVMRYEDMKSLLDHPQVACIGEIMNYRQIIKENDLEITKLLEYLNKERPRYTIEGHCPALVDEDLAKFVYLGIDSDHTEHNIEELKQRFFNGVFVQIQEKMLRQEVLDFIDEHDLYGHFGFVSDDVMADTLMKQGHLDAIVRKAIKMGMKPELAIYHASYTNAIRMKLTDRTMLTPGKLADFALLDSLEDYHIVATYKNGQCIYDINHEEDIHQPSPFPDIYYHSVDVDVDMDDLHVYTQNKDAKEVRVEVMRVQDGSTKTVKEEATLPVVNGEVQWENTPYLLSVVFYRYPNHQDVQKIGYGFVTGDAIKEGAVATTFAHDHHNLLAVGNNKKDLLLALENVISMQGGMSVVHNEETLASLQLNVGGIISDAPAHRIAEGLNQVRQSMIDLGYKHYNPIMSLCTLSLLASPALKISNYGIVDVPQGKVVPLIKEEKL